jgi:hypothetical protein
MRERVGSGAAPHGFALLTLTVAAHDPTGGFQILKKARADFARNRTVSAAMAGGEGHVHAEPARGAGADIWNVHLHAIVELGRRFRDIDIGALLSNWTEILGRSGARGSLNLRRRKNLAAESVREWK